MVVLLTQLCKQSIHTIAKNADGKKSNSKTREKAATNLSRSLAAKAKALKNFKGKRDVVCKASQQGKEKSWGKQKKQQNAKQDEKSNKKQEKKQQQT